MKISSFIFALIVLAQIGFVEEDKSEQIRVYTKPGFYTYKSDLNAAFSDVPEVEILKLQKGFQNEAMSAPSKGLNAQTFAEVKKTMVDHIEQECRNKYGLSDELHAFLSENQAIREAFLLSFESRHDDVKNAIKIFTELLNIDKKTLLKYYHLAIAISVVWDQEDAVDSSQKACIWGFENSQFKISYNAIDVWGYYTGKYQKYFLHKIDKLVWPMLTYIVDYDLSEEEQSWAIANYASWKTKIGNLYQEVKYDYQKIETRKPALGLNRPYTIMNIKEYNGICGDQAHFASRIAKTLGIPSMKVSGDGRFGGSHAWAGYLIGKNGKPSIEFTGRYNNDMYYVGHTYNPQKRNLTLDRHLAMMLDGAAKSYGDYIDALVASRLSLQVMKSQPEISKALALFAIDLSPYSKDAWDGVIESIDAKAIDYKESIEIYKEMLKSISEHPDISLDVMMAINRSIPNEEFKTKQKLFDMTAPLYLKMKRPDLMIELRKEQCKQLAAVDGLNTLKLALLTCIQSAEESTLILPLVEICVDVTKELKLESKVKPYFDQIDAAFPKKRGSAPSEAYAEFRKLKAKI